MSGYFSEIDYFGTDADEFIEIAVPTGTDISSYSVLLYGSTGEVLYTFGLGAVQTTINGHDVYVIDASNPAFDSGGDATGVMYPNDALALVDGSNTVLQFVSWSGNTLTATQGAANGMTSTNAGNAEAANQSLQSDDGGSSYYAQTSTNKGTIPACYARGTLIETPRGATRIEFLRPGDHVCTANGGAQVLRWVWTRKQMFAKGDAAPPICLQAGCLGPGVPARDLVVSRQHRIAIGVQGQIDVGPPALAPAQALVDLPGVHAMAGRRQIQWWHLICDRHCLIRANGVLSETMLLGPHAYRAFSRAERASLRQAMGRSFIFGAMAPALPCPSVRVARDRLSKAPLNAL
ncbi:Hint domain-containing protein [uncultured Tateyamaria sp.]|uniref:Hint domain-containing protein n=1 Tax=Tateyamaria sp. 1078 TaxID=3417464 RepID=UPI00261219E5|nr:Hint domain-containing protein [uncultured Tateyamaria sp.]